ncbi:MAG: hypothetical protein M3Y72_18810 [Acidobacteriota bacterium]|nr:hypothetical protein [Acidobacteriota bacterium]
MAEEQNSYITMEGGWANETCPCCKKMAIGHGWLYREPPPSNSIGDKRKVIGEVFMHDDFDDCGILAPNTLHTDPNTTT